MDILTLELLDVTVSEALREIQRVLEAHPGLPLRIVMGSEHGGNTMLQHNIQRFLARVGRPATLRPDGSGWRFEVPGPAQAPPGHPMPPTALAARGPAVVPAASAPAAPLPFQPAPIQAVQPAQAPGSRPAALAQRADQARTPRPLLITRAQLGQGSQDIGRRLLLGVLRELDPAVPWVGLALDGLDLLDDPQAMALLQALQARGTPVRISRESQLFPREDGFEILEDSFWQRLAGRGGLTLL